MLLDNFLLGALFVLVAMNTALRWRSNRDVHALDLKTSQVLDEVSLVSAVLIVWAEHWGEPPETVKPHLLKALRRDAE